MRKAVIILVPALIILLLFLLFWIKVPFPDPDNRNPFAPIVTSRISNLHKLDQYVVDINDSIHAGANASYDAIIEYEDVKYEIHAYEYPDVYQARAYYKEQGLNPGHFDFSYCWRIYPSSLSPFRAIYYTFAGNQVFWIQSSNLANIEKLLKAFPNVFDLELPDIDKVSFDRVEEIFQLKKDEILFLLREEEY